MQLQLTQPDGPFEMVPVPTPDLADDQVLIRQRVIAFNLIDVKQRGGLLVLQYPHVLGTEGAGIVEAVGPAVQDMHVGDEVMARQKSRPGSTPWGGAFQSRVVVPWYAAAKKPKNISLEEAASLPCAFLAPPMVFLPEAN